MSSCALQVGVDIDSSQHPGLRTGKGDGVWIFVQGLIDHIAGRTGPVDGSCGSVWAVVLALGLIC